MVVITVILIMYVMTRDDKPHNEARRAVLWNLGAIMGRAAVHTGKVITWDEAMAAATSSSIPRWMATANCPAPVQADAQGLRPPSPARPWRSSLDTSRWEGERLREPCFRPTPGKFGLAGPFALPAAPSSRRIPSLYTP